jgi:hypothetical protein
LLSPLGLRAEVEVEEGSFHLCFINRELSEGSAQRQHSSVYATIPFE